MDVSLAADQTGLSDLSAASIDGIGPYIGESSPSVDSEPEPALATPVARSAPVLTPIQSNATPGPSRLRADLGDKSNDAWTPSPEADASRSKSSSRSIHRTLPRNGSNGNESMGSSLGTFDFSNASFSESFLRQAGAHMLAGLDEAPLPPPAASSSSSSPRYRTSSSPTVTARPIRAVDPRTPFTGKSLRTRMAEAGMLDSPASSDGSSPASSPTTRMLPESYTRTLTAHPEQDEHGSARPPLDSPQADRFSAAYSPSEDSPQHRVCSRFQRAASPGTNSFGLSEQQEWQEGLSMVPEESYVEDASQLPSSSVVKGGVSLQPRVLGGDLPSASVHPQADPDALVSSSISIMDRGTRSKDDINLRESTTMPQEVVQDDVASSHNAMSEEEKAHAPSDLDYQTNAQCTSESPRPRSASPAATPSTAPRTLNTPRSFARLRVGTPARSSPLSRIVNFSPSSAGSAPSQWQSPVSQMSSNERHVSSPAPTAGDSNVPTSFEGGVSRTQSSPTTQEQYDLHLETPSGTTPAHQASARVSHLWSPATSASFATPASQRPGQHPTPPTSAAFRTSIDQYLASPASASAFASPAADFGTPQWSPSPASCSARSDSAETKEDVPQPDDSIKAASEPEEEEPASSACSSASAASERKQGGDVSTSSQPPSENSPDEKNPLRGDSSHPKPDLSLASTTNHLDSPSAARFSRMQLSKISPPSSLPPQVGSVPELGLVANAFDSLTHLADSRVSRLLSQLSASTARVAELEHALDTKESESVELQDVRATLSKLSEQYEELVRESDAKDAAVADLVKQLQEQLKADGRGREVELERQLAEERRLREVERRDYEVRIQGLLNPAVTLSTGADALGSIPTNDQQLRTAVEQAKDQLRLTLEKDFDIRRAMEQRDLLAKVERLERDLASTSPASASADEPDQNVELHRQIGQLTADLDRRFEELDDLRSELDTLTSQRDTAEERIAMLEEQLDEARSHPRDNSHSSGSNISSSGISTDREQLVERVDTLQSTLAERELQIERLEETLSLTNSRLASLTAERDTLAQQHTVLSETMTDSRARMAQLESHILTLESELRTRTPSKTAAPASPTAATATATGTVVAQPGTPAADRMVRLERELSSLQLQLVKMAKAHDALQEDNVHFSIALSAKQLELGMVKRNARFALKNAASHGVVESKAGQDVGLARSKSVAAPPEAGTKQFVFPAVPEGGFGGKGLEGEKENVGARGGADAQVNQARLAARQMLAQRRQALSGSTADRAEGGHAARRRQMVAA